MQYIDRVTNLRSTRVLLRINCDVPTIGGEPISDFRLEAVLPTLQFLHEAGARILLISHIGRDGRATLKRMADFFGKHIPTSFAGDILERGVQKKIDGLRPGEVLLFENLRAHTGEMDNDMAFARHIASHGDVYVNDDFATSHRAHASIVSLPKLLPHYGGLLMRREIEHLSRAFTPPHPFLFVAGGAKFETKLPLITKFLDIADTVFVTGALFTQFLKAQGFATGASAIASETYDLQTILRHPRLVLPTDMLVHLKDGRTRVAPVGNVGAEEIIADIGPTSVQTLETIAQKAKLVVWNGPLGIYESGYRNQTEAFAKTLAQSPAESIVGGGDTIAALHQTGVQNKFSFVSTGGGAMIEFLAKGTLPGIDALNS